MDKINLANWNQLFSKADQRVLFASNRYSEQQFHFEEPGFASGSIQSVSTPGMQLTEFFLNAGQPFQLIDDAPKETAESVFVLAGDSESRFDNIAAPVNFNKGHHNIQYNAHFASKHIMHSPAFHALTITYDLAFLKGLLQSDDNRSISDLANCLYSGKTFLGHTNFLPYQGRIAEVIGAISTCRFAGVTRYLFLESKMMELFVLQMEQVQETGKTKPDHHWSVADRNRLHAVKQYIENAYLEVFTLKDLTYQFGLNEFKLKKGYKQFFQTTVFGHVHQLRMQKAKTLLHDKAMNVSEAAFFIGYNNVSSFCTEFKKRFGYSPGKH
jgi:AraC-like DNA-binding protein